MNKLQLYRSAEKAAEDSLGSKNQHEIQTFALDRFNSEKLQAADFGYWKAIFDQSRQMFEQLATLKADSANQPK